MQFIPFALPSIADEEVNAVSSVLRSGWLTTGNHCAEFESAFKEYVSAPHALAVNSATAGLHLALEAVGVGPGDRVVTTPYTFTATAEVIRYLGADPVFVDIDPDTLNINTELVEQALRNDPGIKAMIPVHFAGQGCDMTELMSIARRFDVRVIEDAAHALPSRIGGETVGGIGDITVFSFYVTKTLCTGEGGMVTTGDAALAERMRCMRLHGINRDVFDRYRSDKPSWFYEVVAPGYKYNMTDIAAAIGIEQLRKLNTFHSRRLEIAEHYNQTLKGLPLRRPVCRVPHEDHAWHLYVVQLELDQIDISRDEFIRRVTERGVGLSVHFIPLHLQPYWRERYSLAPSDYPVALDAYQRAVSLPIYPGMTNEQVETVVSVVRSVLSAATNK